MGTRFKIEQEMDHEPVYVCDDATDPDRESREIVTISPHYGTPAARRALAMTIVVALEGMAESGEETKQFTEDGLRVPKPDPS